MPEHTRESVQRFLEDQIRDVLELDSNKAIRPHDSLKDDLGLDSLGLIDIVERCEAHFTGIHISDEELQDVRTVQDAVDLLCRHLGIA